MSCQSIQEQLGPYLDGELPSGSAAAIEAHVAACPACRAELCRERELIGSLMSADPAAPLGAAAPDLWMTIERRLRPARRAPRLIRLFHKPLALAASLGLLIGAAAFVAIWLNPSGSVVQADAIDYRLLLDGLSKDADASVNRFLEHYGAVRMDPAAIAAQAPPMHLSIPRMLPGGFMLQESYRLKFGASAGYAAKYRRDAGEPVFVFFHTPVQKTMMGVHRDSHCSLAQGSHCVEVGPWQLIHFTDPTTCHCLLSRSTNEAELRAMLAAISPEFPATQAAP